MLFMNDAVFVGRCLCRVYFLRGIMDPGIVTSWVTAVGDICCVPSVWKRLLWQVWLKFLCYFWGRLGYVEIMVCWWQVLAYVA